MGEVIFELYLKHGRSKPDEELNDWGFEGPRLQGVIGVHQTYGHPVHVFFRDQHTMLQAKKVTGWTEWDCNALTMKWHQDLVVCFDGIESFYYGDWGLIAP